MPPMRGSLFTFPAGRRAKWIVFALWFLAIFAALSGKLPEKFEEAENNEATSYLPGDAEATKALAKTEELQKGEIVPTVIVFRRDSGLTAADFRTIEADVKKMTAEPYPGVIPDGETAASGGKPAESESKTAANVNERGAAVALPPRSPASPPTTPPSSARSARKTAKPRSSPPTSTPRARPS
jgi:RND superfamily putative drug exporter